MPKAHNWIPGERGIRGKSSTIHSEKPGQWYHCDGCGGKKFYWDGMSDFQKQLEDAMCFVEWRLKKEFEQKLRLSVDPSGEKGYHALLSDDCALAAMHETIELIYDIHES